MIKEIDHVDLKTHYINTRKATEIFCSNMEIEDYVPQPAYFASPPKWHLAHTTWFFEEFLLKKYLPNYEVYHEDFGFLFNSYYNFVGNRTLRHERGLITRPTVSQVYQYRNYIDKNMEELFRLGLDEVSSKVLLVGINHEEQHQELLKTDFKYLLHQNPLFPVYSNEIDLVNSTTRKYETEFIKIEEGLYEIGHSGEGFSYDNELGRHKVFMGSFEISKSLVTCGEYIEFIESGAYQDFSLWLDEAWVWVQENEIKNPLYWHIRDGEWWVFTFSGLKKVNLDAPMVHINFYEAQAFASWKRMRLPTEFEWEVASDNLNWGERWEWTNSAYLPYPGFKIEEGALGEYNGKFMINQMVLRGASSATSVDHSRKTYRNFFHPEMRWQYSGIRLVKP